ncbi:hypothetical protein Clacol_004076 [Clathrus columnatus]|uniref:Protein YOP1 n=1 Tax=Clathrus columnatus TaxID=1419009 RepID=A0AAV5A8K5_9AGAM|nr:hypothetical protein Clacol_004076 [Clathrus columnatus]
MGVVKLFSRLLTTWVAFLYPAFASYKALSHRPVSEPELERWVKYWTVVGVFVGAEYLLEWLVSWFVLLSLREGVYFAIYFDVDRFPLYWEVKTAAVLYLALPQTQGSTYIYNTYLGPYFQRNEVNFDRNIETAQTSIVLFAKERAQALIQFAWNAVTQAQAQVRSQQEANANPATAPPAGSPAAVVSSLWKTYGSSIITGISRAANTAQGEELNVAARAQTPQPGLQPRNSYTAEE